ncbi:hypothetical protein ACQJBY_014240 [Aegilops geniculata]
MDHQSSTTQSDLERMLFDETAEPKALPLSLLAEITNGFSDKQKIGEGGFAVVYQGMLQNGKVAVKRLSNTHMYEKEFHREVECLMMVKHKNVVRFLGYCADTQGSMERYNGKFVMADVQQRLLCFEYLPNGSLDKYITDISLRVQWRNCFQIIKGICQGLHYLHQKKILHLDLKPTNILLDGNLVPKIADFGVSRCFNEMQSRAITVNIGGTLGYLAPEFCNGEITYQFDIYSLGVIIIEILTGKKGYHAVDIVVESWSNKLEKSQSDIQLKQVRICAEIGIECTDFNPAKRPGTKNIIDRLVPLNERESMDGYIVTSAITSQQAENAPNELHQDRPKVPGEISSEDFSFHQSSNLLLNQMQPDGHARVENTHLGHQQKVGRVSISNSENIMAEIVLLLVTEKIRVALANGAANQASPQLSKHATKLKNLQGSMGRVVRELSVMYYVVCEMDIRYRNNQVYKGWLDQMWKVAHAMEDTVDGYLCHVGRAHDIGCCFYLKRKGFKKPRSLLSLSQIAFNLEEIEKDLSHLSEMNNRWVPAVINGDTRSSNFIIKRSQNLANISRPLDEEGLVGVEKNREKLEQWLRDDEAERSVIALLGMGGLGKTALAANVYRKERGKFQCNAWVSISQTYSRADVLRNIIKDLFKDEIGVPSNIAATDITCLEETLKRFLEQKKYFIILDDVWTPEAFDNLSRARLEETLKRFLEQKKYFIILDDVWTPEAFDNLSRALVCNNKGSRLIITTRDGNVAALASQGHILTLEALPEEKAWDLFCKKSFPRETNHQCPEELKPLSMEIISLCKGLPLAIVSIGSLLRVHEETLEEWRRIHDQLSWEIINSSWLDHIRNVLHLSFMYLPTYLKSCLLYCSLFPVDYLFHTKKLVRLWMAEGFIEEKGRSTLEEVAEGYIKELISRNMFQLVERNSVGRIKRFRMHDIIRELAVDMCQKGRFGVIYEEDKFGGSLQGDERRLVVHKLQKHIHQTFYSIHGLRTFITLDASMPSFTLLPLLSQKSRYLTVIELSGLPIEKIPDAIGDLYNLRHLGLRYTKVKVLPKSIERLSNLLTLDLALSDIQELPRGIVKLKKLRHLFAEKGTPIQDIPFARGVCIPIGLWNLTNLQTLRTLKVQDESIRHLGELRQLQSLSIWGVKGMYCKHLCESLVQMQFLSNLVVNACDENEVLVMNALPTKLQKLRLSGRLPEGALLPESPLFQAIVQNLCALRLSWSQLRGDPLPSLSRLANLTHLYFSRAYSGEKLQFLTGWFPKLKKLYLWDMPNLKRLEILEGAMTALETLVLGNLESMAEVPPGLEFLTPLQNLCFQEITRDFLTLLRQSPQLVDTQWRHTLRDDHQ